MSIHDLLTIRTGNRIRVTHMKGFAIGVVECIIPASSTPTEEMMEKYWWLRPGDKHYTTICKPMPYDRIIIKQDGKGTYFIFANIGTFTAYVSDVEILNESQVLS
jgi:hypothetical protein